MNISTFLISIFLILLSFLTAPNLFQSLLKTENSSEITLKGKTMGTFWLIRMIDVKKRRINELYSKIQSQLDKDENQLLSTYKENSILMRFNRSHETTPWLVSKEMANIITESLRVGYKTNGAMDITIGSLVNLWGFGPSKPPSKIPDKKEISSFQKRTGLKYLTVINKTGRLYLKKDIPDLFVDLSTIGEGYAADHLTNLMLNEKISRYLVSVGSSTVSCGMNAVGKPWRVAIRKPTDQQNLVQAIVGINGYGISTSGNYQNYYELDGKKIFHIIDPRTGYPITNNMASVTVIAKTALEADAWDTGLMVLGLKKAKKLAIKHGLAVYMIVRQANTFVSWASPQFSTFLIDQKLDKDTSLFKKKHINKKLPSTNNV